MILLKAPSPLLVAKLYGAFLLEKLTYQQWMSKTDMLYRTGLKLRRFFLVMLSPTFTSTKKAGNKYPMQFSSSAWLGMMKTKTIFPEKVFIQATDR